MTNSVFLNPDLHYCKIDGEFIFLDVARDRYFCFNKDQSELFSDICAALPNAPSSPIAGLFVDYLRREQVLLDKPSSASRTESVQLTRPCVPQHGDCYQDPGQAVSALRAGAAYAQTRAMFSLLKFKKVLTYAEHWVSRCPFQNSPTLDDVLMLTSRSKSITPFLFTSHDACLFRSFFLLRYLALHGIPTTWVFGVQQAPFAAHCWIEFKATPLNEHSDNTENYVKIMTI